MFKGIKQIDAHRKGQRTCIQQAIMQNEELGRSDDGRKLCAVARTRRQ